MSGKAQSGNDLIPHDSETVRARLAIALRRRVPCCCLRICQVFKYPKFRGFICAPKTPVLEFGKKLISINRHLSRRGVEGGGEGGGSTG